MLFEDIELLIVLSEAKSLSQAADQLFMSRPGLSQRITSFEKRVGRKLFERTSTGITPTKAGELVINFARNTADLERVLASQLAAIDERFDSTLDIGMSVKRWCRALAASGRSLHEDKPGCPRASGCRL